VTRINGSVENCLGPGNARSEIHRSDVLQVATLNRSLSVSLRKEMLESLVVRNEKVS
jgi:hypothetical protein